MIVFADMHHFNTILSLLPSEVNFGRSWNKTYHVASDLLLPEAAKFEHFDRVVIELRLLELLMF